MLSQSHLVHHRDTEQERLKASSSQMSLLTDRLCSHLAGGAEPVAVATLLSTLYPSFNKPCTLLALSLRSRVAWLVLVVLSSP